MKTRMIAALMGCLLLAACEQDDRRTDDGRPVPVAFSASVEGSTTRAANDITTEIGLANRGGFGVFGCYTGLYTYGDRNVHPDFMYNEHITYDTDIERWMYSPLKYWPNGEGETTEEAPTGSNPHYVSFFAYAPYSDGDDSDPTDNPVGYCIPSFSSQGEVGNPWLTYRLHSDLSKQVDLLWAPALTDQRKPDVNRRLPFQFRHALACVGDRIVVTCSGGMKNNLMGGVVGDTKRVDVIVDAMTITYSLTSKARMVLWNGGDQPNWQPIVSETPMVTYVQDMHPGDVFSYDGNPVNTRPSWMENGHGVFYIPLEVSKHPQQAVISITYKIRSYTNLWPAVYSDSEPITSQGTLVLRDYPDAYMPGKKLTVNISIDYDGVYGYLVSNAESEQW